MKAIGYNRIGEIEDPSSLVLLEVELPELDPYDLLVEVKAVSVNPVDVKVRRIFEPEGAGRVTGYDVSGVVCAVGSAVTKFQPGHEVYYAGDLQRAGANAEFHAVDEALVGHKPQSLSHAQAASLPLTTLTAWELLFDSFGVRQEESRGESILIVGAAGGVGSMLIQLVHQLTYLNIVAGASRRDSIQWVNALGADCVINHHDSIPEQLARIGVVPKYVASLIGTERNFTELVDSLPPFGHLGLIDDPEDIPINYIKHKALSLHWEFMFARSMHEAADMDKQGRILNRVAELVDAGYIQPTVTLERGVLTPEGLHAAHLHQSSGQMIGKQVFEVAF